MLTGFEQNPPRERRVNRRSLSVLYDLRPAFEGFYGIPQETRLTFPLLQDFEDLEVTGLIEPSRNDAGASVQRGSIDRPEAAAPPQDQSAVAVCRVDHASGRPFGIAERQGADCAQFSLAATADDGRRANSARSLRRHGVRRFSLAHVVLALAAAHGIRTLPHRPLRNIVGTMARDARDRARPLAAPWPRKYASIDTSGYDVLVAHSPWPGIVGPPETRLVVRYHNSMPVFLPHTVKQPRRGINSSTCRHCKRTPSPPPLRASASIRGRSCCSCFRTPGETGLSSSTTTIADDYFPEPATHETVTNIITSRIDAEERAGFRLGAPSAIHSTTPMSGRRTFALFSWFRPWSRARTTSGCSPPGRQHE